MARPKADPIQIKLNRQQRNQRYRTKPQVKERIRIQHKIYKQKKKEEARPRLHQSPLAQLADIVIQQGRLEVENNAPDMPDISEEASEDDVTNKGVAVDEVQRQSESEEVGQWGDERDGHFDEGFPDESESDRNNGFDGGFPDEPESGMDEEFSDGSESGTDYGPDEYSDSSDNGSHSAVVR